MEKAAAASHQLSPSRKFWCLALTSVLSLLSSWGRVRVQTELMKNLLTSSHLRDNAF